MMVVIKRIAPKEKLISHHDGSYYSLQICNNSHLQYTLKGIGFIAFLTFVMLSCGVASHGHDSLEKGDCICSYTAVK